MASLLVSDYGHLVSPEFQARCLTVSFEQMHAIPRVIAAAGGAHKAFAVAAIVRAGLRTELVTDKPWPKQHSPCRGYQPERSNA